MSNDSSSTGKRYLSPGEVCERWSVDYRTLQKFELPWVELRPHVRRIDLRTVEAYEQGQHLPTKGDPPTRG
jgi:hypothetical protein